MTPVNDNLPTLLVVEDEKNTRDGLRRYFEGKFDIYLAPDVATAMNVLETEPVDVLLTDLRLTGGTEGLDMLSRAQSIPRPPVTILMTAYGSEKVAVQAMKRGAYDYITKPLDLEKLDAVLTRALHSRKVESENRQLREELDKKFGLEKIIGNSPAMVEIFDRIRQVAPTRATVLIEGESGTGKELVAQSLHMLSTRRNARFVAVHCAALSSQLLESELFGHEKGAFTGAMERRIGRFEEANHGTIFLDEIGEIDAATQVKLLRVLGEGTVQRVGSNQNIKVDARVVAATNKNLEAMVREGKFREDLFYRLDVVPIELPPLRERREDIPLLVEVFLKEFARANDRKVTSLSADAQEALQKYPWPGNVRQLRATIERAVVLCRGERIGLRDLPPEVQGRPVLGGEGTDRMYPGGAVYSRPVNLNLEEIEKSFIQQALKMTDGNITEAAKLLGISRRTLHRKIKSYRIDPS
jgi:two-component system response regulator AtoC